MVKDALEHMNKLYLSVAENTKGEWLAKLSLFNDKELEFTTVYFAVEDSMEKAIELVKSKQNE